MALRSLLFLINLLLIYWCLGPVGNLSGLIISDGAIPVIMSNEAELSPYHLYYFGQDRLGAWPYIILFFFTKVFSFSIEPASLFFLQALFFSASSLLLLRLFPKNPAVPIFFVIAGLLHPVSMHFFLAIAHPYAASLCMLACFWSLRIASSKKHEVPGFLLSALYLSCFLAMWTSPSVVIFLLMIHWFEKRPLFLHSAKKSLQLIFYSIPLVGLCGERILRFIYENHVNSEYFFQLENYHFRVKTDTSILLNDFFSNCFENFRILFDGHSYFTYLYCALSFLLLLHYFCSIKFREFIGRSFINRCAIIFVSITLTTILFSTINWVRIHHHPLRYHVPQLVLMNLASLLMAGRYLSFFARKFRRGHYLETIVALSMIIFMASKYQNLGQRMSAYGKLKSEAQQIAGNFDRLVVLDTYSKTYIWQAFAPNRIIAQPIEQNNTRIPWTPRELKPGIPVLSCYQFGKNEFFQFGKQLRFEKNLNLKTKCAYKLYKVVNEEISAAP